jgi:hypothetical protein
VITASSGANARCSGNPFLDAELKYVECREIESAAVRNGKGKKMEAGCGIPESPEMHANSEPGTSSNTS